MATATTKSLNAMSAAERLAFYRSAVAVSKPAEPSVSLAERAAIVAAATTNFGTNFKAAYRFHRVQ